MTSSWPNGPVYDPVPTLPPDPTVAPADPDVAPLPLSVEVLRTCDDDCTHIQCKVAKVGAAEILRQIGERYDDLPREQQQHYETVASHVMAAMSDALLGLMGRDQ